jgi:PAS domain-containing protein
MKEIISIGSFSGAPDSNRTHTKRWTSKIMADIKMAAETVAAALGALGALGAALVSFNKKVVVPFRGWIAQAEETNKIVKEQLTANGGSSLKDAVTRIERTAKFHHANLHAWMALNTRTTNTAVFETNERGQCTWVDPVYRQWTGKADIDVLGEAWLGVIYTPDREDVEEAWQKAVMQRRDFKGTYRIVDATGVPVWVECVALVTRFHTETLGYLGCLTRCGAPPEGRVFV